MLDLFSSEVADRVTRDTSIEAMKSVEPRAENLRGRCWGCLQSNGPLTTDEVADLLDENILSVRPQFTLLTKESKIEDTGKTRLSASGRKAIVWRALPPSEWVEPEEAMPAKERIAQLEARVSYLEHLLTTEGIKYERV